MSEWRNVGYVPDSEDEEESLETQSSKEEEELRDEDELSKFLPSTTKAQKEQQRRPGQLKKIVKQGPAPSREDDEEDELAASAEAGHRISRTKDPSHVKSLPSTPPRASSPAGSLSSSTLSPPPSHLSTPDFSPPRHRVEHVALEPSQELGEYVQRPLEAAVPVSEAAVPVIETHKRSEVHDSAIQEILLEDARPSRQMSVQVVIPQSVQPSGRQSEESMGGENDHEIAMEMQRRGSRTFRSRKAIQLHPYVLENERYRRTLQTRGLRPVNIIAPATAHRASPAQHQSHDADEYSSDAEFSDASPPSTARASQQLASSSPRQVQIPSSTPPTAPNSRARSPPQVWGSDDDLPDLKDVLRPKPQGAIQLGRKRLKTVSNSSLRSAERPVQPPADNDRVGSDAYDQFGVPPSPTRSHDAPRSPSARPRKRLILPPQLSPAKPPTPLASSTRKVLPSRTTLVHSNSDSDDLPISTARRKDTRVLRSRSSSVSSTQSRHPEPHHEVEERALQPYKKRIRGVLPASYIRLDQEAQAKKPKPQPRIKTTQAAGPSSRPSSAGKASSVQSPSIRPNLPRSVDSPPQSAHIVIESDESDSAPMFFELTDDIRIGDAEEHDWIDTMAPPAPRTFAPRQRKRQSRLEDLGVRKKQSRLDRGEYIRHDDGGTTSNHTVSRQPRTKHPKTGNRKQSRPKPPKLGVLDSAHANARTASASPEPDFMRIARRQARKDPNKGRHSPGQKHVRLQTQADTEDALTTLREWRAGTLAPRADAEITARSRNRRRPLEPRADNNQQARLPSPVAKAPHEASRVAVDVPASPRVQPPTQNRRLAQTRLNPVVIQSITNNSRVAAPGRRPAQANSKKRQIRQPVYRTGQLEEESSAPVPKRGTGKSFRKHFQEKAFSLGHVLQEADASSNPQLDRFLYDDDGSFAHDPVPALIGVANVEPAAAPVHSTNKAPATLRRPRKLKPRRLDVQIREFRQPSDPLPGDTTLSTIRPPDAATSPTVERTGLQGLGPYGTRYPTDFDVLPLEIGTFFHNSTFLGSGEFQDSFDVGERDFDAQTTAFCLTFQGQSFRWHEWSESVSSDLSSCLSACSQQLEQSSQGQVTSATSVLRFAEIDVFLRSVTRYVSKHLVFFDSIDSTSFVEKMIVLLTQAHDSIATLKLSDLIATPSLRETCAKHTMYYLALLSMVMDIARLTGVHDTNVRSLFETICKSLISDVISHGRLQIQSVLDENRYHSKREAGIRADKPYVEAFVVLSHAVRRQAIPGATMSDLVHRALTAHAAGSVDVPVLENIWHSTFSLLPLAEIGTDGLLEIGARHNKPLELWQSVKALLSAVLDKYPQSTTSASINEYVRACLIRCHNLIQHWGWRKADSALSVVFSFFTRHNLTTLTHETYIRSSRFVDDLSHEPNFTISPDDRAFHIFLKTVALTLKSLRAEYDNKKFMGAVWRFIPNHDRIRMYDKAQSIREKDLDSLRNHHDVLCVLYWVARVDLRPRLINLLRNLVDHDQSHRAACKVNIRAWSVLAKYQLSSNDSLDDAKPVASWGKDLIRQTIEQYRLASTEGEKALDGVAEDGVPSVTERRIKSTVLQNQGQFLASLGDIISGTKAAFKLCTDEQHREALLQGTDMLNILALFHAKSHRVNKVVTEVLQLVQLHTSMVTPHAPTVRDQESEESQDYGDFPTLDDFEDGDVVQGADNPMTEALWHLMSNAFGADAVAEEKLLVTLVCTWASHITTAVNKGQHQWETFLETHGKLSWQQLRGTEQTRMYTVYFMAQLLRSDATVYDRHGDQILACWLVSLVERTSQFKFQHDLTAQLLRVRDTDRLLRNLPFVSQQTETSTPISIKDVQERRLSILSSVLHNMRDTYEDTVWDAPDQAVELQRRCTSLLKQLMAGMRKNYLQVQEASSAVGAYVSVVHKVVEMLQQYTAEICPIDRFFTDSSTFPLPPNDPGYVIGRLKGYGLRLSDTKTVKKLAVFLQTTLERAAVEQQQDYLVDQISVATAGAFERGNEGRPTLRQVLLQVLVPCYVDISLSTSTGWLLAKPLMQASTNMFHNMLYDFSCADAGGVAIVSSVVTSSLALLSRNLDLIVVQSGLLEEASIVKMVGLMFENAAAILPIADYLQRRIRSNQSVKVYVDFLAALRSFVKAQIIHSADAPEPRLDDFPAEDMQPTLSMPEIQDFCSRELNRTLTANWSRRGDVYFVANGTTSKVIDSGLETVAKETERLAASLDTFEEVLAAMPAFTQSDTARICEGGRRLDRHRSSWTAGLII